VEHLKKERDQCEREIMSLSRQHLTERTQTVASEIQGLTKAIQYAQSDIKDVKEKIKAFENAKAAATKQLKDIAPRMSTLEAALKTREANISSLREQIARVQDATFADFSKSVISILFLMCAFPNKKKKKKQEEKSCIIFLIIVCLFVCLVKIGRSPKHSRIRDTSSGKARPTGRRDEQPVHPVVQTAKQTRVRDSKRQIIVER
jgi:chaperonin cofactor prefoldin